MHVHAHLNLLGWVALGMAGLIYAASFAIVPVSLGASMVTAGVVVFAINVLARIGERPSAS
jgi:hypothetical protein